MAIKTIISDDDKLFYITFTCYDWLPLIDATNSYDLVYKWFNYLRKKDIEVIGYVIMPNHIHCLLNFPERGFSLNTIISNGKRFMAYEIINRLTAAGQQDILSKLQTSLTSSRLDKGQLHSVFRTSFDAKAIRSGKFLWQKMKYMHMNPVRGNYNLVEDWRDYPHSSAGYYENGMPGYFMPVHYEELT